jgi:hypothetical protein
VLDRACERGVGGGREHLHLEAMLAKFEDIAKYMRPVGGAASSHAAAEAHVGNRLALRVPARSTPRALLDRLRRLSLLDSPLALIGEGWVGEGRRRRCGRGASGAERLGTWGAGLS